MAEAEYEELKNRCAHLHEISMDSFFLLPRYDWWTLPITSEFTAKKKSDLLVFYDKYKSQTLRESLALQVASLSPTDSVKTDHIITENNFKGPRHGVNLGEAVNRAAFASCHQFMEQFKEDFMTKHDLYRIYYQCKNSFPKDATISSVLKHYEHCQAVASLEISILLYKLFTKNQSSIDEQMTTDRLTLNQRVSKFIRQHDWFKDDFGCVIIPNHIDNVEKRFIISVLLSHGLECVIATHDGGVRDPEPREISVPNKRTRI